MLSIVIPTLNEEEFLPQLLESLARQTFRDFEVIVADAGSSDRTQEVARSYGCRLVKGGMPGEGRNNGVRVARGDLILFLDADVVLPEPRCLERILSQFEGEEFDIATPLSKPISDRTIESLMYGFYNSYIQVTRKIFPHAGGFCILVRKSMHEAIGGFDAKVRLAEDHDYARRAGKVGSFGILTKSTIPVSTRRFERDGHFKTACRYVLCELHMWAFGSVRSDFFRYRFGYEREAEREEVWRPYV